MAVRHALIDSPTFGNPYMRIRPGYAHHMVRDRTRIVMDGFPRSANSYAWFAFLEANPECKGALAGHTHSIRTVIEGARRTLPSLLLVRDPRDVCASYLRWLGDSHADWVYAAYARFYESALPHLDRMLVAPFDVVTADFGVVIEGCNAQFGTEFRRYAPTVSAEAHVIEALEESAIKFYGTLHEAKVARPSRERRANADVPSRSRTLRRAARAYERIMERSGL